MLLLLFKKDNNIADGEYPSLEHFKGGVFEGCFCLLEQLWLSSMISSWENEGNEEGKGNEDDDEEDGEKDERGTFSLPDTPVADNDEVEKEVENDAVPVAAEGKEGAECSGLLKMDPTMST